MDTTIRIDKDIQRQLKLKSVELEVSEIQSKNYKFNNLSSCCNTKMGII